VVDVRVTDADVGLAVYPAGSSYGPRRLIDWEVVWIIEGSATWRSRMSRGSEQLVKLMEGDVLVIPPGSTDAFDWDRSRRTHHGWVHAMITEPPPMLHPNVPAVHISTAPAFGQQAALPPRALVPDLCRLLSYLTAVPDAWARPMMERVIELVLSAASSPCESQVAGPPVADPIKRLASYVGQVFRRQGVRGFTAAELA
jgi:hypothetical protein